MKPIITKVVFVDPGLLDMLPKARQTRFVKYYIHLELGMIYYVPSFPFLSVKGDKLEGKIPVYSSECLTRQDESHYFMGWYPSECFISYKIVNRDRMIDEILL
jgi:hypothetical protein